MAGDENCMPAPAAPLPSSRRFRRRRNDTWRAPTAAAALAVFVIICALRVPAAGALVSVLDDEVSDPSAYKLMLVVPLLFPGDAAIADVDARVGIFAHAVRDMLFNMSRGAIDMDPVVARVCATGNDAGSAALSLAQDDSASGDVDFHSEFGDAATACGAPSADDHSVIVYLNVGKNSQLWGRSRGLVGQGAAYVSHVENAQWTGVHEVIHSLGVSHSSSWFVAPGRTQALEAGYWSEYGNCRDVMGTGALAPTLPLQHRLGWVSWDAIHSFLMESVAAHTRSLVVAPINTDVGEDTGGRRRGVVIVDAWDFDPVDMSVWVYYRAASDCPPVFRPDVCDPGVEIAVAPASKPRRSAMLHTSPHKDPQRFLDSSRVLVGSTWSSNCHEMHVTAARLVSCDEDTSARRCAELWLRGGAAVPFSDDLVPAVRLCTRADDSEDWICASETTELDVDAALTVPLGSEARLELVFGSGVFVPGEVFEGTQAVTPDASKTPHVSWSWVLPSTLGVAAADVALMASDDARFEAVAGPLEVRIGVELSNLRGGTRAAFVNVVLGSSEGVAPEHVVVVDADGETFDDGVGSGTAIVVEAEGLPAWPTLLGPDGGAAGRAAIQSRSFTLEATIQLLKVSEDNPPKCRTLFQFTEVPREQAPNDAWRPLAAGLVWSPSDSYLRAHVPLGSELGVGAVSLQYPVPAGLRAGGRPFHVVWTVTATETRLWVDGIVRSEYPIKPDEVPLWTSPLYVGSRSEPSEMLMTGCADTETGGASAVIRDVLISNVARPPGRTAVTCSRDTLCQGHGECRGGEGQVAAVDGACACDAGYGGPTCSKLGNSALVADGELGVVTCDEASVEDTCECLGEYFLRMHTESSNSTFTLSTLIVAAMTVVSLCFGVVSCWRCVKAGRCPCRKERDRVTPGPGGS
uniref:EGF-like domain-containing protein n=1 Tax=Bicosoecida sp. CB-2014 TaxID=1486930 RepID=A0A7S1G3B7_9STRA|mmetsp:Transcript_10249/g.35814  ORF Transcript_10249/g.35814 Transcript_10249/m.35814 type:complete len:917 (+) Transcript_10249:267-3017(+)